MTSAEWNALDGMLGSCDQRLAVVLLLETVPTATLVPAPTPSAQIYDPFGSDRNCGDFDTWVGGQEFYEAAGGRQLDRHRLDRDRDGIACESLPGAP